MTLVQSLHEGCFLNFILILLFLERYSIDDMFGGDEAEELNEDGETAAEAAATKARLARMELARKLKEVSNLFLAVTLL